MDAPDDRALQGFIYREAQLLDTRRYDEWLALFTADGRYWVPLQGDAQADPDRHNSIALEDRLLLSLKVDRLRNPQAHSQHPQSRCQHVLQQPMLERSDPATGRYELRTPFVYTEVRGMAQVVLAGCYHHQLVHSEAGLHIRLKRVDLLNAGAPLPAIQLFP